MARKRCVECRRRVRSVRVFPGGEGVCQACRMRLKVGEYADPPPKPAK